MSNDHHQTDAESQPGDYLAEVLESVGMSQAELARRLGRPAQAITEIIGGAKALTAETALQLERVLDVPAYIWNQLEADYQLIKARKKDAAISLAAERGLLRSFTFYPTLASWGFVPVTSRAEIKIEALRKFFQVNSLLNAQPIWQAAFRTWSGSTPVFYALAAWLRVAAIEARKRKIAEFNEVLLVDQLPSIREMNTRPVLEVLPALTQLLADCGIALIIMQAFPGTKACGAALWLKRKRPVVIVSDLGKKEDSFWFNLFHELGHILLHGQTQTFADFEKGSQGSNAEVEEEANDFACDWLIPAESYEDWTWQGDTPSDMEIVTFAESVGVQPGIVVGRLCSDGILGWGQAAELRRRWELPDYIYSPSQ